MSILVSKMNDFMIHKIYKYLLLLWLRQIDLALLIVHDLPNLDAAQVVLA